VTGTATDLQDGRAVDADAVKKVDDALLGGIQPTTPLVARLVRHICAAPLVRWSGSPPPPR